MESSFGAAAVPHLGAAPVAMPPGTPANVNMLVSPALGPPSSSIGTNSGLAPSWDHAIHVGPSRHAGPAQPIGAAGAGAALHPTSPPTAPAIAFGPRPAAPIDLTLAGGAVGPGLGLPGVPPHAYPGHAAAAAMPPTGAAGFFPGVQSPPLGAAAMALVGGAAGPALASPVSPIPGGCTPMAGQRRHSSTVSPGGSSLSPPGVNPQLVCGLCPFIARQKHELNEHMKIHQSADGSFGCQMCDYTTMRKSNLIRHHRVHTGEKPFGCQFCPYRTAQKGDLTKHMRIHTGEKPFACPHCEYRAVVRSHLRQHVRTHTGEKPFSCPVCDYRAGRKGVLLEHMKTHRDGQTGLVPVLEDDEPRVTDWAIDSPAGLMCMMPTGQPPLSVEVYSLRIQ